MRIPPGRRWTQEEQRALPELRSASDEAVVLADAIDRVLGMMGRSSGTERVLDYGAEAVSGLSRLLAERSMTYVQVGISGPASEARFLVSPPMRVALAQPSTVVLSHVLPYCTRPAALFKRLAEVTAAGSMAVVVVLEPSGDQHEIWQAAGLADNPTAWGPALERALRHYGTEPVALTVCSVAQTTLWMVACNLVGFFLARSPHDPLTQRIASGWQPDADGRYRFRTAHRVLCWPLKAADSPDEPEWLTRWLQDETRNSEPLWQLLD